MSGTVQDTIVLSAEERLKRILGTDAVGVLFFDSSGVLVDANDAFLEMSGYTREEVTSATMHWRKLTPPEYIAESEAQMQRVSEVGRVGPYEKEYFMADGSRRWMMFSGVNLGDGSIAEFCLDLTKHKQLERQLQARNDDLERFNKVTVGRELRMIELKQQVNELCERLGEPPRYTETPDSNAAPGSDAKPSDARRAALNILEDAIAGRLHAERSEDTLRLREAWLAAQMEALEERVHERTAELLAEVNERRAGEERIKNLLRQLVNAEEQGRQRISRELHDTLGQQLAALHLIIEALKSKAEGAAIVHENIKRMRDVFDQLNSNIEFLAWELRPPTLDLLGLDAAIDGYVHDWGRQFGVEAVYQGVRVDGLRLSPEAEINIYRILQEALQNVHKHAGATRVNVVFERRDQHAVLIVEDNGQGYDVETTGDGRGMGLTHMRERAALIGGTIEIESKPGDGVTVFVLAPLN